MKKYSGITDAEAAKLAATKLIDSTHRGAMWYRIGAVRRLTGGKQIEPILEDHLRQVYNINYLNNKYVIYKSIKSPIKNIIPYYIDL